VTLKSIVTSGAHVWAMWRSYVDNVALMYGPCGAHVWAIWRSRRGATEKTMVQIVRMNHGDFWLSFKRGI